MNIKEDLQEIFRSVFDDETIVITEGMTAEDIEDWDSLAQINLIMEAEKRFKIKFNSADVMQLKNVGEFIELIQSKI